MENSIREKELQVLSDLIELANRVLFSETKKYSLFPRNMWDMSTVLKPVSFDISSDLKNTPFVYNFSEKKEKNKTNKKPLLKKPISPLTSKKILTSKTDKAIIKEFDTLAKKRGRPRKNKEEIK